jgi:sigma-B regulation protein RsbU (phosphoserine phosphatase)
MGIDDTASYQTEELQLSPSDMIFLFTDGVTECRNIRGDFYKESGLESRLKGTTGYTSAAVCDHVLHDLQLFSRGAAQSDDVTMATLQWMGPTDRVG